MVKQIIKDELFLSNKSTLMTKDDLFILDELIDTLKFNRHRCVGMAANMIGYLKTCLVFVDEKEKIDYMINPTIINASFEYNTFESCLSLNGERPCKRFKKIKVEYYNKDFQKRIKTFSDFTAQIIQHEMDHFSGKLI